MSEDSRIIRGAPRYIRGAAAGPAGVITLIPEALVACGVALPYKIGGGAALIVICTILDIKKQVRDVSLTNPGGVRR